MFADREEAGEQLAEKMKAHSWDNPLFLALPRGGVVVARSLQRQLGGELDLYITRKIGAPSQPELAIGAVAGDGSKVLDYNLIRRLNISEDYVEKKAASEQEEIERRMQVYRGERPLPEYAGRQVVLVDDGVATGSTVMAAIQGLKEHDPAELMVAVPVGPPDTIDRIACEVDGVFFVDAPPSFMAVGQFYVRFAQVQDQEVIDILQEVWGNG